MAGRLRVTQEAVKMARVVLAMASLTLGGTMLSGCSGDGDVSAADAGPDRWNRAGMKVAAQASALRHQFDDGTRADSSRVRAANQLLALDPEFLAIRYGQQPVLLRQVIDNAVAAADTQVLALVARLFETRGGEERIEFALDMVAFGAAARPRLAGFLQRSDRGLVVRAADALAKTGVAEAAADIGPLLHNADDWIRMGGAHALGQLRTTRATELLLTALEDSSYAVVNAALVGLASQRATVAHEPALALLRDGRPEVRKHAAHTLGQIGSLVQGARTAEALERASQSDPDSGVRFMAKRALQALTQAQ